jgi:hypothetical protein
MPEGKAKTVRLVVVGGRGLVTVVGIIPVAIVGIVVRSLIIVIVIVIIVGTLIVIAVVSVVAIVVAAIVVVVPVGVRSVVGFGNFVAASQSVVKGGFEFVARGWVSAVVAKMVWSTRHAVGVAVGTWSFRDSRSSVVIIPIVGWRGGCWWHYIVGCMVACLSSGGGGQLILFCFNKMGYEVFHGLLVFRFVISFMDGVGELIAFGDNSEEVVHECVVAHWLIVAQWSLAIFASQEDDLDVFCSVVPGSLEVQQIIGFVLAFHLAIGFL